MGLVVPIDGRITSQNVLTAPLDETAVMEVVSPGNAANGNTYQVSLLTLAAFFASYPALNTTIITTGATSIVPYAVLTTDTRILFNKTVGAASFVTCPLAANMQYQTGILFKDAKGDAATNTINIRFTAGELCDGQSVIVIGSNYGWVGIAPYPGGGAWYQYA